MRFSLKKTNQFFKGILVAGLLSAAALQASSVTLTWNANTENDLAGYKVYYSLVSQGNYKCETLGKVTECTIDSLNANETYYFCLTAYDGNGNESDYSQEVAIFVPDNDKPHIVSVMAQAADVVKIVFDEEVSEYSAEIPSNYSIQGIIVNRAERQADKRTVLLYTNLHQNGQYSITVTGVKDSAQVPNTMDAFTTAYSWNGNDETIPTVESVAMVIDDIVEVVFSEAMDYTSIKNIANYVIDPSIAISGVDVDESFTTVRLWTAKHNLSTEYTLTVRNVKDAAQNLLASQQEKYSYESSDATPPSLMGVYAISSTQVDVAFSEAVNAASAQTASNYAISGGVSVSSASLDANGTTIHLTTSAHADGSYTITVSNVGDMAPSVNFMNSASLTYSYSAPDVTAPQVVNAWVEAENLVKVQFSEALNEASACSAGNYFFQPSLTVKDATLSADGTTVLLHVGTLQTGTYTITMNNIKDLANNLIPANSSRSFNYQQPDLTPPEISNVLCHGANLVEVIFTEGVNRAQAETIANYAITPGVTISEASLIGDNLDRVYLTTSSHTAGVQYKLSVEGIMDRSETANVIDPNTIKNYSYSVEDVTAPQLVSASLIGLSYVKVTFSEPLDQATAETVGNYTISNGIQIYGVTLDASYQVVFLQTSDHIPGQSYEVNAFQIKDRATPANTMSTGNAQSYSCISVDNTAPALVRADAHGPQTVELVFSEPLEAASALSKVNYQINNGISIQSVTLNDMQTSVFLQTSAHVRDKYTVTVSGVKDASAARNLILAGSQVSYDFIPADAIAPIFIQAEFVNTNTLELLFSEPLNRQSATNTANYSISGGVQVQTAELNYDGNKVFLRTSNHLPGTYTVSVSNLADASAAGNLVVQGSAKEYTYATVDNDAPKVLSAVLYDGNRLYITFDEALDATSASETVNYKINNGMNVESAILTASKNTVVLFTSEHPAGSYSVTVNGVCDATLNKNVISNYAQTSYGWNPPDHEAPALVKAELLLNNRLTVYFSEEVNQTDAETEANYQISGGVTVLDAVLLAGLSAVRLTTSDHEAGEYTVSVSNIHDRAMQPNVIAAGAAKTYRFTPPDTDAPELVKAYLGTSPRLLKLVFDESLSREAAQNEANYSIDNGILVSEASLTGDNDNVVFLETQNSHQTGITYNITVSNLKDRAPTPNVMSEAVSMTYTYSPPDTEGPVLLTAKLSSNNLLDLVFNEELDKTTAENAKNYQISGANVLNAVLVMSNQKVVRLETSIHQIGMMYTVYVSNLRDQAATPNPMNATQSKEYQLTNIGGSSVDTQAPAIARVDMINNTTIDVLFTEAVDRNTAETKGNYAIEGLTIKSATLDSNSVIVRLATSTHNDNMAYSLKAQGIKDASANVMSQGELDYYVSSGMAFNSLSRSGYEFRAFGVDNPCYNDRDYTFSQVPTLLDGSVQVLTANADKDVTDEQFLSLELSREVTIFMAYDSQIQPQPEWLNEWRVTGEQVVTSRNSVYRLYSRDFNAGRVTLPGNSGNSDDNMYMLFVKPFVSSIDFVGSLSKATYQISRLEVGDAFYVDREYTLAGIPNQLDDVLWVRTQNDDKTVVDPSFLSFNLLGKATVFVAYDATINTLPTWLDSFDKTVLSIVDSRGNYFDVYARDYNAGEVVLGGNEGGSDDNMYLVMIKPDPESIAAQNAAGPGNFDIFQNYPNPFNPRTTIRFYLKNSGHVKLGIYNVMGQLVNMLVDEDLEGGITHAVVWEGVDSNGVEVASGMYFYRLVQGHFAKSNRMILMR